METTPLRSKILDTIIRKSTLKQRVFDNTFAAFNELKETLFEMASEMDDELDGKLDRGHGMSTMKGRAKQLQGQCLVESGPGYGTTIRLTLPL